MPVFLGSTSIPGNTAQPNVTDVTATINTNIAGSTHILSWTVSPSQPTSGTVTWTIEDAGTTGASMSGDDRFTTTAPGTVQVKITISVPALNRIFLGSTAIQKVYLGSNLVWSGTGQEYTKSFEFVIVGGSSSSSSSSSSSDSSNSSGSSSSDSPQVVPQVVVVQVHRIVQILHQAVIARQVLIIAHLVIRRIVAVVVARIPVVQVVQVVIQVVVQVVQVVVQVVPGVRLVQVVVQVLLALQEHVPVTKHGWVNRCVIVYKA